MHLQECVDAAGSIAAACRAADMAAYSLDTSSTLSIHRSSKRAHDEPPAQWHVSGSRRGSRSRVVHGRQEESRILHCNIIEIRDRSRVLHMNAAASVPLLQ